MVRKRALLAKFGEIGDVIMAIPAVHSLYEEGVEIDWLCGRAARPLLECYSWTRMIPVDDRVILRGRFLKRAVHVARLWHQVALVGYELCATLYYDRRFTC
jgi:heptosyltransferase II